MSSQKKQLLVVADDFGVNKHRSHGIIELMKKGVVTSASVLANGECTSQYLKVARDENIESTQFGAHLNLTEGIALTGHSSLTDENGRMLGKVGLRKHILQNKILPEDIKREIHAQVSFLQKALTAAYEEPVSPTHFDGHNHMHTIPEIVEIISTVVSELGFKSVRIPNDVYYTSMEPLPELVPANSDFEDNLSGAIFHKRVAAEARSAASIYKAAGLSCPDSFFGLTLMGDNCSQDGIEAALTLCPDSGIVEVMTHVGDPYPKDAGSDLFFHDFFSVSPDRKTESDVWCRASPSIASKFSFVTFGSLAA